MKENILWTLAFIGLFSLLNWSLKIFRTKEGIKPNTSLVLQVYNWENNIERLVRFIASSCYFNNSLYCPVDVIFVDMGSADHTLNIIRKLSRQFAFIKVIDGKNVDTNNQAILEYTKDKCQGDAILFIDTSILNLDEVQRLIKFYFNHDENMPKVLG